MGASLLFYGSAVLALLIAVWLLITGWRARPAFSGHRETDWWRQQRRRSWLYALVFIGIGFMTGVLFLRTLEPNAPLQPQQVFSGALCLLWISYGIYNGLMAHRIGQLLAREVGGPSRPE